MRGDPGLDFRDVYDDLGNSLVVDAGEYGVGGLSASDEQTLDFRRTRPGFWIGEGDLIEALS
jgi:hypothetical protein